MTTYSSRDYELFVNEESTVLTIKKYQFDFVISFKFFRLLFNCLFRVNE
jgi:hypothetical protein